MKTLKQLLTLGTLLFSLGVSAEVLDPKYVDNEIEAIHHFLQLNGAVTLDQRTASIFVNDWTITAELVELEGKNNQEVAASWNKMIAEEKEKIFALVDEYGNDSEIDIPKKITEASMKKYAADIEKDGVALTFREGVDHEDVRNWLVNEFFTPVTKAELGWYFTREKREKYDYLQFSIDDMRAETVGEQVVFIRGIKKVIVIRTRFCQC